MVAFVPVPDASLKFMSDVFGIPEFIGDSAFNSKLRKSRCPAENSTLEITLNVFLKQVNPEAANSFIVTGLAKLVGAHVANGTGAFPDSDAALNLIKPWTGAEWRRFVDGYKRQAMRWHNKFWLLPPDDFTLFDLHEGGARYRPNVFCAFKLNVVGSVADAHTTIEVVNLYNPANSFRSDSVLYASNDIKIDSHWANDAAGHSHTVKQPTVTHEVGHALGLPHIGETRSLQECAKAKLVYDMDLFINQSWLAAIYQDGSNASVCYGEGATIGDINNIMGMGSKFAKENASPWLDRLSVHLLGKMDKSKWTAHVGQVHPKRL